MIGHVTPIHINACLRLPDPCWVRHTVRPQTSGAWLWSRLTDRLQKLADRCQSPTPPLGSSNSALNKLCRVLVLISRNRGAVIPGPTPPATHQPCRPLARDASDEVRQAPLTRPAPLRHEDQAFPLRKADRVLCQGMRDPRPSCDFTYGQITLRAAGQGSHPVSLALA